MSAASEGQGGTSMETRSARSAASARRARRRSLVAGAADLALHLPPLHLVRRVAAAAARRSTIAPSPNGLPTPLVAGADAAARRFDLLASEARPQVVVEDYVHDAGSKFFSIVLINFASVFAGAPWRLFAVLKIALWGARPDGAPAYQIVDHTYDVVVVGAGGVGPARDAWARPRRAEDRLHHQGLPDPQPHRGARRAGSPRSLGNMGPDHWTWHMYDTVKGSDWLGDQDAIEYMVREAPAAVYELEHCRRAVQPHQRRQDLPARRSAA